MENCKYNHLVVGYGSSLPAGTNSTVNAKSATLNNVIIALFDGAAAQNNGGVISVVVPEGATVVGAAAKIGNVYYATLQSAIDACAAGNNTITLLATIGEDVTIKQTEGVNIVIDGNNNTYTGTMTIHGAARHTGEETLTIQEVNFVTSEAGHYFIDSNSTGSAERYAHNVTVKDSTFTATGAAVNTAAAMRIRHEG